MNKKHVIKIQSPVIFCQVITYTYPNIVIPSRMKAHTTHRISIPANIRISNLLKQVEHSMAHISLVLQQPKDPLLSLATNEVVNQLLLGLTCTGDTPVSLEMYLTRGHE
jgi:hypothetical protein